MAQREQKRGLTAARLGATGSRAVVGALAAVAALCLAFAFLRLGAGAEVTVSPAPAHEAHEAPADDSGGTGSGAGPAEEARSEEDSSAAPSPCRVHVDGAVAAPGVYELAGSDLCVNDAIEAAGGLVEGAQTAALNLAAPLESGSKVHVPLEGEEAPLATAGAAASGGVGGTAPSAPAKVNINRAGLEELCALPGVGEATARAIVEDREANGPFASPEDLMRVSGIGEKKFAKLEGLLDV